MTYNLRYNNFMLKKLWGNPPINAFVFYTGKLSGYIVWFMALVYGFILPVLGGDGLSGFNIMGWLLLDLGGILVIWSLLNLGGSTSLGVPDQKTFLKTSGPYRFSRNPMYVGFNLWTLAGIVSTFSPTILLLGVYSIATYHFIIIGEELFLRQRFGKAYIEFTHKVRRYL